MRRFTTYKNESICTTGNFFILACIALIACKTVPVKREIKAAHEISSVSPSNKYIKAHMKDGNVYILHDWVYDSLKHSLNGFGSLLDINRKVIEKRETKGKSFNIELAEISLVETNDPGPSLVGGMAVVTGITAGFGIYCAANPKACFGSCPTFYASNGDSITLQAEGFSSSVAPSLERNDIDMLYSAHTKKDFVLMLTNEALETHSIRFAHLLAFEKQQTERVFAGVDGLFYRCRTVRQPTSCQSQYGDCLNKIMTVDGNEYFSLADANNLDSKEEINISFTVEDDEDVGLVVGKRQTLMTTFLLYQELAYMGNSVTYWMSQLERRRVAPGKSVFDILGGIEVFSRDGNGNWKTEGSLHETGPIATDFNIVPLAGNHKGKVDVKLRLNKGLWRIDFLGLATISGKANLPLYSHIVLKQYKDRKWILWENLYMKMNTL